MRGPADPRCLYVAEQMQPWALIISGETAAPSMASGRIIATFHDPVIR